ncbi:hypothetical protein CA13_05340 [Planctomycetes bacterium CA13]|uniref:Arylsulfatase n=1 Tax=Novipirellula herctigrandis TaxID=2527986 RepID=A0A5C5YWI2_9BACT|nr:hypothetical protein CA13_05340 [Planctomycetes bacterium CA13]
MRYPPLSAEPQLYKLKDDPKEKVNLATTNPQKVKELSAGLDEWYVPTERQSGTLAAAAPKPRRRP